MLAPSMVMVMAIAQEHSPEWREGAFTEWGKWMDGCQDFI